MALTPEAIGNAFNSYYYSLYNLPNNNQTREINKYFEEKSESFPKISQEVQEIVNRPFEIAEVLKSIKRLKSGKAPGPDGFDATFYKIFADTLAPHLTETFIEFNQQGKIPEEILRCNITPILKPGKDPENVLNYRPISLLNTDYKIYSDILNERLKLGIKEIIHRDQVGFIPGRSSADHTRNLINLLERGGLGVPVIQEYAEAALLAHAFNSQRKEVISEGWYNLEKNSLDKVRELVTVFWPQNRERMMQQGGNGKCLIIQQIMKTWQRVKKIMGMEYALIPCLPIECVMGNMSNINLHPWKRLGIEKISDLYEDTRVLTFKDLKQKYKLPESEVYNYLRVKAFVTHNVNCGFKGKAWELFKDILSQKADRKMISNCHDLIRLLNKQLNPPAIGKWEQDLQYKIDHKAWNNALVSEYKLIHCLNLNETFYKLMNRWYLVPTNMNKINTKHSPICWRCHQEVGDYLHIWWHCSKINQIWNKVKDFMVNTIGCEWELTPVRALLHLDLPKMQPEQKAILVHLLTAVKLNIAKSWKTSEPPVWAKIMAQLSQQCIMERGVAYALRHKTYTPKSASDNIRSNLDVLFSARARGRSMLALSLDAEKAFDGVSWIYLREVLESFGFEGPFLDALWHLNDLKKENFSLKLRIYFLEERIQQKYEDSNDDVYKRNIELKVEVESLKRELQEKQQFLDKSWTDSENFTRYNEVELRRQYEKKLEETGQVQELLENKIQLLLEEVRLSKNEADRMLVLVETEKENCMELKKTLKEFTMEMSEARLLQKNYCITLTEKDKMIEQLTLVLDSKDSLINQLTKENQSVMNHQVRSLEQTINELQTSLQQKDLELKLLEEILNRVTTELNSARELSHSQERIIEALRETLESRDREVVELNHALEENYATIAKLQGMLHKNQTEYFEEMPSQLQLLDLQNTIFCTHNEFQKLQQALRQKDRQLADAKRSQRLLEADLLEGQNQKETSWKHNQELHGALHKLQVELQKKSQQFQNLEEEKSTKLHTQEQIIQLLSVTLSQKEQMIQEYVDILECQQSSEKSPGGNEQILEKLRQRIKDKDVALEHSVDAKFCTLEEKEKIKQLKMIARERGHNLEQLHSVLSGNEETINSLDNLVKAKDLDLEQISAAYKNLHWLKHETEDKHRHSLSERDIIVQQLQSALQDHNKEVEEMTACLLRRSELGSGDLVGELQMCLQRKEKLLQKALYALSQQAYERTRETQELLSTITSDKVDQTIFCRSHSCRDLSQWMLAISAVRQHTCPLVTPAFRNNIRPADTLKNDLTKANNDPKFELKKEGENQLELSALQSIIIKQNDQLQEQAADMDALSRRIQIKEDLIKDLQMQLVDPEEVPTVERLTQEILTLKEKLASSEITNPEHGGYCSQKFLEGFYGDRTMLNQVLQTERELYSSLIQFHNKPDSSALQAELHTAQALRCQLEDVLAKATERLAKVELESKVPAISFGGLIEDDDYSSSQFTDSIDDQADACIILPSREKQEKKMNSVMNTVSEKDLQMELLQIKSDLKQVTDEKTKTEEELCLIKEKFIEAGLYPAADIRNFIDGLCLKKGNMTVVNESTIIGQNDEDGGSVEENLRVEIKKLQGKMKQDETVIKHLKVQLALNSREREGTFNPDLIVSMAKEIERLNMATSATKMKRSALIEKPENQMSKRHCSRLFTLDVGELKPPRDDQYPSSALSNTCYQNIQGTLDNQALQLKSELANTVRQKQELQEKLVVSEATVHAQIDQLEQYRLLLDEPVVEQVNKHVQVDHQDPGYETCGRSENEGDRDETTSPEYEHDDLFSENSLTEDLTSPDGRLLTNSAMKTINCLQNDWTMDWEKSEDIIVLQQHMKNLKAELQKSQKLIKSLQNRPRYLSASSYCPASPQRLKHSVSFHGSTSHSITDEDEGWQSGTVGAHCTKDLEQLVKRVSMLEAQLHQLRNVGKVDEQMRSATWPGKYDSLIQAQARELSLLRQKLREGRTVGNILNQHLGDTIKSFEELLRANDIDYYMGQAFREQLAQGNQLTGRLYYKLTSKEHLEADDKYRHELLAIRLSKELQQKDKVIESLQSKLDVRSVTPSSSHAITESDQSDRTSFVSDDQLSTNEDLDATINEYDQYEQGNIQHTDASHIANGVALSSKSSLSTSHDVQPQSKHHLNAPQIHSTDTDKPFQGIHSNLPPNISNVVPTTISTNAPFLPFGVHPPILGQTIFSLAEVQKELYMLQKQLAERMPLTAPAGKPTCPSSSFFDTTTSTFPSFPHNLKNAAKPLGLQIGTGFRATESGVSVLWDMPHLARTINMTAHGDTSSGSSGYQSAIKSTGSDLLKEHLNEVRNLQQHLEKSIRNNDSLREQLEEKLTTMLRWNGSLTNIYIQGLESILQVTNENRSLREENLSLLVRINQITKDYHVELEKMQELLSTSRSRLKDVEMELEDKTIESKKLQEELETKKQELLHFQKERLSNQEKSNRLQHQATLLEQQLNENCQLLNTLQSELQVYERVYSSSKLVMSDVSCNVSSMEMNTQQLEENAPNGFFANKNGHHVIGHFEDFSALKQQIMDANMLMKKIETLMQLSLNIPFLEIHGAKALDYGSIKRLFFTTSTLQQILEESTSMISLFWRAALPNKPSVIQQKREEQAMKDEICQLRANLKEQEKDLQEAVEHLKSANRAKEGMENFIVSQLTKTHDVLKKTKSNLKVPIFFLKDN
ncbi:LOW QUALITY PROTEIN: myomegalin-like [Pelodytes ibericus]